MTTTNLGRVAIVPKGTYTAGPNKPLDLVRYQGASYLAKTATSALPTVTADWDLIAGDGASLYTWIKYADDSIGTGLSDSPVNKLFIGIAVNKASATESTVAADYTWSQIKGNDGSPTYTWIKYADDAIGTGLSNTSTGKKYIGIAVNKLTTTESTSAGDYEWSLIVGDPLYTWIKYADDSIGGGLSDSPTGKSYIGIAVNKTSATESTTASDYAWSLLSGGGGGGTVTSVAALTLGTTGTDVTSTVATGTTTPVITLNLPTASSNARGLLSSADWSTFNSKLSTLPTASTTVLGGVKVDGTSITISNGVISGASTYTLPTASTTVLGGVKVDGTTVTISNGVISAAGGSSYTLPTASTSVLGGVKVDGSTIKISGGVISAHGLVPPPDPYLATVKLLVQAAGISVGATTFTDTSPTPKTLTTIGNTIASATQARINNVSIAFDGTGDGISYPSISFSEDFTVEAWVYRTSAINSYMMLFGFSEWTGWTNNGNTFTVRGTNQFAVPDTINQWAHIAVVRSAGTVKVYFNGAAATPTSGIAISGNSVYDSIGLYNANMFGFAGYMDNIRFSTMARYTTNFTPQLSNFSTI